jgi:predicted dehydrogenase
MVKIGLLGTGHLGKIHLRLLKEIEAVDLVGFYDANPQVAQEVADTFGVKAFESAEALIEASDAVDIVTPTLYHHSCAQMALAANKHIFIEKPLTHTLEEAEQLMKEVERRSLKAQVGHVERFNPALLATEGQDLSPMFVEGHRLALYNPRGTDVSVVLDLMIHDLDVVLSLVKSPLTHISASGVAVVSSSPDIANARLEFANGCVANLTASRISLKNMRRLRLFQPQAYVAVDFLEKKTEVVRLSEEKPTKAPAFEVDTGAQKKYLLFETPNSPPVNAIKMELEEFARAIEEDTPIRVSLRDGYRALKVAHQIVAKIEERQNGR